MYLLSRVFPERKQSTQQTKQILSILLIHVNYTGKSIS